MSKDTFCSHCGECFKQDKYPKSCNYCFAVAYHNPSPVVVAIIPVNTWKDNEIIRAGWLIEQRNIDPGKGGWALPGGYIEFGETWQQAAARELQEELGIVTSPEDYSLLDVVNSTSHNLLIFCTHKGIYLDDIRFIPNSEVSDVTFPATHSELELCFPTHNEMWKRYCESMGE